MGFEAEKSIPSLIIGVILIVLGLIPLLEYAGVIGFGLPGFLTGLIASIVLYLIAGGGLYLIVDAFLEGIDEWHGKLTLLFGLIFLVLGLINLLGSFGILPFGIDFLGEPIVFNAIFVFEGVLLVLGSFLMN